MGRHPGEWSRAGGAEETEGPGYLGGAGVTAGAGPGGVGFEAAGTGLEVVAVDSGVTAGGEAVGDGFGDGFGLGGVGAGFGAVGVGRGVVTQCCEAPLQDCGVGLPP